MISATLFQKMLSAQAVLQHSQNSSEIPRVVLICPVRKCCLPLEQGMVQTDFETHVKLCWSKNYLTPMQNDAVKCPLGHITFQEDYSPHNLCHILASDNLLHAEQLRSIITKYTVIPFAFTTPLRDLREIPAMTFNVYSTPSQTLQAQNDFLMLARMAVNRHLQYQTFCTRCKNGIREESFPPLPYIHFLHNNEIHFSRTGDYIPSTYMHLGTTGINSHLLEPTAALSHIVSGHTRSTDALEDSSLPPHPPSPSQPVHVQDAVQTHGNASPRPTTFQSPVVQSSNEPEGKTT